MTITALPTPPTRDDPTNFAARGDTFMAALPVFVTEANALQSDVNNNQATASSAASTATAKASEASAARDIAMAAVNYKGLWSSLSGALNIPASVYHSGSVWLLTESIANVATKTPGIASEWLNVTPASGLGTAAYQNSTAFQATLGALNGIVKANGAGVTSAASSADVVALIGSTAVTNATNATNATTASNATAIADGSVSTAAKIANGIVTLAKMAAMTTGKLIGRSTAGGGSPEEISLGNRLTLTGGVLNAVASDVTSVGGNTGVVTNAQLSASVASALGYTPANGANYVPKDFGSGGLPVGVVIGVTIGGIPVSSGGAYPASYFSIRPEFGSSAMSGTWRVIGNSGSSTDTTLVQRIA